MTVKISSYDFGYLAGDLSVFPEAIDNYDTLYFAKNNSETKLTVDDLFAEDWMVFHGKSLKEVLDDLDAGKTIRRKSWYPEYGIGIYSKDIELNLQDLTAHDWESIDVIAEVNECQNKMLKSRQINCS